MIPKVYVGRLLPVGLQAVWSRVRDFNGLPSWHPAVAESRLEQGASGDSVGCIRSYRRHDGFHIREQLVEMSDLQHRVTYTLLEAPMPVRHYVGTLSLRPARNGAETFAEWTAWFDCSPDDEGKVRDIVTQVFEAGLESLARS